MKYCILLSIFTTNATEYIYPLCALNNDHLLVIDQLSLYEKKVFIWNIHTQHSEQCLWSLYNPQHITLLPNEAAFSFIDNGRLRIQSLIKRSAKTIDFDKPLYNINALCWINNDFCYCSAQCDDYAALFQLCIDGTLCCIAFSETKDLLYPQKIGDHLFYIERLWEFELQKYVYTINQMHYPIIQHTPYDSDEYVCDNSIQKQQLLIDFGSRPIIYLIMHSLTEGFVLEYENIIRDEMVICHYHHLACKNKKWYYKKLFSFVIPAYLLQTEDERCVQESLFLFMPRVHNQKIYFVDSSSDTHFFLRPYCYHMKTKIIESLYTMKKNVSGHLFASVICEKNIFCGGNADVIKKQLHNNDISLVKIKC